MILLALQLLDLLTTAAALRLGATEWNPVVRFLLAQEDGWALLIAAKVWLALAIWWLLALERLPAARKRCERLARCATVAYLVVVVSNVVLVAVLHSD